MFTKKMKAANWKNSPTFIVMTEYAAGVPHVVTARPSAIPDSGVTELSIAVGIAAVLKREVHRVVGMYKPTWNPSAVNSKVSITLHATNLTGGGAQTMDRFKS
jgi:hypothetical protein